MFVFLIYHDIKYSRHDIIPIDVKPTNVLVNSQGQVKLCDFGVSGQLVQSMAKTHIGCQSYMAVSLIFFFSEDTQQPLRVSFFCSFPRHFFIFFLSFQPERISQGQSYTVQSDVWSLGLSILETAEGSYPYPPEKYNSVFAQLSAIVGNPPPSLPDSYSEDARAFVALCLLKDAKERPTYKALLVCVFLFQAT